MRAAGIVFGIACALLGIGAAAASGCAATDAGRARAWALASAAVYGVVWIIETHGARRRARRGR